MRWKNLESESLTAVDEMGVVFASSVLGRLSIVADDVLVNALPTAAPELRGSALWVH